jgi:arsenate reductase
MAEGLCRHIHGERIDAASAGIETHGLNPNAVKVMAEIGIDISNHQSKTVNDLGDEPFDFVITVCGHAHETCPFFPARTRVIHQGFDDPPFLAKDAETEEEALGHYRRVRDEIRDFIEKLSDILDAD